MRALAMRFRCVLRGDDVEDLAAWLGDGNRTALYSFRRFVHTLRLGLAVVRNAITATWNNSQTEGQINRLKMPKRAMYGCAAVELLRENDSPSPSQNQTN